MEKLNEMYPKASEIYLRIKDLFEENKETEYQVSDSLFGNYTKIDVFDVPAFDDLRYKFLTQSREYVVYSVLI